ncbi:hypothetical protein [Komagataeibacter sp. FNDCR2]|uniref:hypothetical protein n=1 Tax=Komagataeibacter sp. FNDCR2 TaxID=2878682 RepID=UPI001E4A87E8|nr:hypothetical protein [Komagataeibacter sp. FNDCR2]MCE2576862.1 hypothetical protein [Komagataeibacter sp. FNDCR2]
MIKTVLKNTFPSLKGAVTLDQDTLNALPTSKQDTLGFTPVQQGGGFDQGAGKIYLGRDTTYPGLRYSYLAPDGETVTGGGYLISSYGPESGGAAGYGQIGDISTDPNGRMAWRLPALGAAYITGALYSDVTAETIRATNAEAQLLPLQNTGPANIDYGGPSLPYSLRLQTDGNLVVYYGNSPIFSVNNEIINLSVSTLVGEATLSYNPVPLSQANSLVSAEAVARADADATLVSGTIGVTAANSDTNGVSLYRNGGSGRPTFVYSSGTGTLAGDIAWAGDLPFSDSSLKMQAFSVTVVDGASVAFPTAFSERPYLFLTPQHNPESDPNKASNIANYYQDTLTASGFVMDLRALWTGGGATNGETNAIEVMVLAIGTMG